ncbi:hypothetical protein FN846DRAFT_766552, partial [Sphaerosporella brunnea]
ERARWEDVVVVGELKDQQKMGDLSPKMVIQISNYVRETFEPQPGRRFVHAFTTYPQPENAMLDIHAVRRRYLQVI